MNAAYPLRFLSIFILTILICGFARAADGPYYQIRIYHFKTDAQYTRVDAYLQKAFVPAMHRAGIKNIGVFTPAASDTLGKRMYVFIPYKTFADIKKVETTVAADQQYLADGKD